ncbi:hypothetical protein CYY_006836 [Polysphondylium violaceum]|uniref:FNIP repeat-containing protein n=1 Tax=Polysphondylium violaceum TaxID=133409 RepID=A0A8J4PQF0_9MYCE|nr:hypothetical protein CYY_006836 [Polysphondylium violaceum]
MDKLFFEIWRNRFIVKKIHNQILDGLTIVTNIPNLFENYKYFLIIDNNNIQVLLKVLQPHMKLADQFRRFKHKELVTQISFVTPITDSLLRGFIPDSVKFIKFNRIQEPLEIRVIPDSVETIENFWECDLPLPLNILPKSLKSISFSNQQKQALKPGMVPDSVETISFENCQDQPHRFTYFPPNLTQLTCGTSSQFETDYSINFFPNTLKSLHFITLNQPLIEKLLPSNLTSLSLGPNFHQEISPGLLPSSLTKLSIRSYSGTLQIGAIPFGVKELHLKAVHPIQDFAIPQSVTNLSIDIVGYHHVLNSSMIPSSVTKLEMVYCYLQEALPKQFIPPTVTHLTIGTNSNNIRPGQIPPSVTFLKLFSYMSHHKFPQGTIPDSVKHIRCSSPYAIKYMAEHNQINVDNIKTFGFDSNFDMDFKKGKPKEIIVDHVSEILPFITHNYSVEFPSMIPEYASSLMYQSPEPLSPEMLPSNLKRLQIHNASQVLREGLLPNTIESLEIVDWPDKTIILEKSIPSSVKTLDARYHFTKQLYIPSSVRNLRARYSPNEELNIPPHVSNIILEC